MIKIRGRIASAAPAPMIRIEFPYARLLVADAFCALTAARAYRGQLSAEDALLHLAESPGCYDGKVVAALAEVVVADDDAGSTSATADSGTTVAAA